MSGCGKERIINDKMFERFASFILAAFFTSLFVIPYVDAFPDVPSGFGVIKGSFYKFEDFSRINNVVIEVNTTPKMRIVVTNGYYYLNLTPGCYEINAYTYIENGRYSSSDVLCIKNGDKVDYDFILLAQESEISNEILKSLDNISVNYDSKEYSLSDYYKFFLFFLLVLIVPILALMYVYFHNRRKTYDVREDEHLGALISLLKEEKRITQKEINKRLPLSEAKISLMLSQLEDMGKIKKIKKGRTNIIYWKGK